MISNKDPQETLNPKPKESPYTCQSSHGTTGFKQGTKFDPKLGVYVCPCGRQYRSKLEKPDWMQNA